MFACLSSDWACRLHCDRECFGVSVLKPANVSLTDSAANFQASALKLGLDPAVLKLVTDGGVDAIAKYAFVSSFVPGGSDEWPFVDALTALLKRDPTVGELAVLRRLHVECYSLTAADQAEAEIPWFEYFRTPRAV